MLACLHSVASGRRSEGVKEWNTFCMLGYPETSNFIRKSRDRAGLIHMNLLWLSHLLPFPPKGGAAQRSYHLIKLASEHFNIDLVAFNQRKILKEKAEIDSAVLEFKKFCSDVHVFEIPSDTFHYGNSILAIRSLLSPLPYNIKWLDSPEVHSFMKNLSINKHYDLIWCDTISLIPYVKYFNRKISILNHHNIESDMMFRRSENEYNPFKKIYYKLEAVKLQKSEKKYCNLFSLNVTCSELDKKRLQPKLPSGIVSVIPNGVDTNYFKATARPQKPNSLVFAGTLSWYPNKQAVLFFLNKIWPLLKIKIPSVNISFIGKDPPERLIQVSKIDPQIKVTGFVDDVRPYIEEASVYVCPIMDGGGTKLKILDALSMGKAIVAHPVACEGIDVRDGESVLFAETPDQFADKITFLLSNDFLRFSMGIKGRALIERLYSYEQIGKTLIKELKSLSSDIAGGLPR